MPIDDKLRENTKERIAEYRRHCAQWHGYNHKMDSISFALALLAGLVPIAVDPLLTDVTAIKWITSIAGLISAATVATRTRFYWEAKSKFYARGRAECDKLLDQLLSIESKQQLGAVIVLLSKLRDDEATHSGGSVGQEGVNNAMEGLKDVIRISEGRYTPAPAGSGQALPQAKTPLG